MICFENTLKIQPDFEAAAKRKHAVLCHAKLESALEQQHRYVKIMSTLLHIYASFNSFTRKDWFLKNKEMCLHFDFFLI